MTTTRLIAATLIIGLAVNCIALADSLITTKYLVQTINHVPAYFTPLDIVEITGNQPAHYNPDGGIP